LHGIFHEPVIFNIGIPWLVQQAEHPRNVDVRHHSSASEALAALLITKCEKHDETAESVAFPTQSIVWFFIFSYFRFLPKRS